MDFARLLNQQGSTAPVDPSELYESLPDKAPGYGYLRAVQEQVLHAWHGRRGERDLVVKVNTGAGKTIDGLVILRSYLNEGKGPCLYVAASKYLVEQVTEEAERIHIPTVDDPDNPKYLAGEAIAVVNINKLVNGRSVFSDERRGRAHAPIGCVVVDDVHAALATTRDELSIEIPTVHPSFPILLNLFEDDIRNQSPNAILEIHDRNLGTLARVPFWAWRNKVEQVRAELHKQRDTRELFYRWPAIQEVLHISRAVFTGRGLTITPTALPIRRITAFNDAAHRIYLTATLADDSVLVTDFAADPESIRKPITPGSASDIGERMILAPAEINPDITDAEVRQAAAKLAEEFNVVVIVPSDRAVSPWEDHNPRVVHAEQVPGAVAELRGGHVGLVVMVNKYDGIDLPGTACRVLVLDGLPEAFGGDERLESQLTSRVTGIDGRQVQRIEQGMGRGVRSNEDHCVVLLVGPRLSQLVVDPRSLSQFGPASRAQLALSRTVAQSLEDPTLGTVVGVVMQALRRDEAWVTLAKNQLKGLKFESGVVAPSALARRAAMDSAMNGDYPAAESALSAAVSAATDEREIGRLQEQLASYVDHVDPARAQTILARARANNSNALRPLSGVTYRRLSPSAGQAQQAATFLTATYATGVLLRLGFEAFLSDLQFDPDPERPSIFESAVTQLALHVGLAGERPEKEQGAGPDNLWALGNLKYWVIEAKSGAINQTIGKRDAAQLSIAMDWFLERYDASCEATPVMIHPGRQMAADATARAGMRVITEGSLAKLRDNVRAFAAALAGGRFDEPTSIDQLLIGHHLRASDLQEYLSETRSGR